MAVIAACALIFVIVIFTGLIIYIVCDDLATEQILKEENEMVKFMLKYGDENKMVADAQKLLQAAGSTIKVTGKYTIGMISAVKAFQKKNGLVATGKIDTRTMNKLKTFAKPAKRVCRKAKAVK